MFRADSLSDVIWQYGAQYVDTPSGLVVPDYDLAEKYQYNGLFSKIIDRPAEEALKHGMKYNVGDPQLEEFLDDALDRLDWEDKATTAIRWARLFGGSIIVMLLDDGGGLEEPVNWQDVRSVEELLVYERAVVQPDPDTYRTGKATYFDVSSTYGGFSAYTAADAWFSKTVRCRSSARRSSISTGACRSTSASNGIFPLC